jgi:hypothetical protein
MRRGRADAVSGLLAGHWVARGRAVELADALLGFRSVEELLLAARR